MEIKINRLTLENFKCHRLLNLQLEGQSVSVYGDNATGKTSIYDALTWLLFGKDSQGNGEKNIDIKPLNSSGEVKDHQAITSVEAELQADGETVTLRRTYREVWATRRGTGEPVYEGNTSDYFVDGVPQKKNIFDARVRELVPEDLFRMLTSVSYFAAGMKWQDRRAVLFDMTGTLTDKEIMAGEPQFATLLESLGKLSLADYKAKLLSQKKGLTGVRDDAPTRINECMKILDGMQWLDFAGARQEEQELSETMEVLHGRLAAMNQNGALAERRLKLDHARFARERLAGENRDYRRSQESPQNRVSDLEERIERERKAAEREADVLDMLKGDIRSREEEIQRNREVYADVNGEAFSGGSCPTCGQKLPFDQLREATRRFEEKKQERLAAIILEADHQKRKKEDSAGKAERIAAGLEDRKARIRELEAELSSVRGQAAEVRDMPGYREQREQADREIAALEKEVGNLEADGRTARDNVYQELEVVKTKLRKVRQTIAQEAVKEQTLARIEELKADARNASEALERIENMLYLMEEFTRYKANRVESSVNDLFRLATFRLFREQNNGGLEERCDAQHDGVPFMGLNNGMKVNVGIDIINTLSRHYGTHVPLFIDNAEAVTRLEPCNAQVIRLVVSEEDKELRIV